MRGLNICVLASAAALLLACAGEADAALVTVGSTLPATNAQVGFLAPVTVTNTALAEPGANVVSPISGAVVGFTVMTGEEGGTFGLRVLRPAGSAYTSVASSPMTPFASRAAPFEPLPIQAGDAIGLDVGANSWVSVVAPDPAAAYAAWSPPFADGSTLAPSRTREGRELEFNALVEPPPTIASIMPASGSFRGGTHVLIRGENLIGTSSVKFGARSAVEVQVLSEHVVTAITTPTSGPRRVAVRLTTAAGTSPPNRSSSFALTACVVPRLVGRTPAAARKAVIRSKCRPGAISRRDRTDVPRVVAQSPRPGRKLDPGSRVSIVVG